MSSDRSMLARGCSSGKVRVNDLRRNVHVDHGFGISIVARVNFSHDGRLLLIRGWNRVQVRDVRMWKTLFTRRPSNCLTTRFCFGSYVVVSSTYNEVIHCWEAETGKAITTLKRRLASHHMAAGSFDGKFLASSLASGKLGFFWNR